MKIDVGTLLAELHNRRMNSDAVRQQAQEKQDGFQQTVSNAESRTLMELEIWVLNQCLKENT